MIEQAKALTPVDLVRNDLQKMEGEFRSVLPPHITPERFTRVVMTAVQGNPALLNCDRKTLFSATLKCATDGLLPDGREAALVQYGSIVQYLPMVGGILKKIRNSGELGSITSQIICEKDKFRYWVDDSGEHIEHDPVMLGDRGKVIGVYALAKTTEGAVYVEVMNETDVMKVKSISRAKGGPWSGPFEHEMWRKTAIRRLSKRLPMSTDVEQVIHRDDELYELPKADKSGGKAAEIMAQVKAPVIKTVAAEVVKSDEPSEDFFEQAPAGPLK